MTLEEVEGEIEQAILNGDDYAIPNEIVNIRMLHNKNLEEAASGIILEGTDRVIPDFKLYNNDLGLPTENLRLNDVDNSDLKIQSYTPKFLSFLPEEVPLASSEVSYWEKKSL